MKTGLTEKHQYQFHHSELNLDLCQSKQSFNYQKRLIVDYEKGYFEDRRPSSNMDPYLVTSKLFETTVLD